MFKMTLSTPNLNHKLPSYHKLSLLLLEVMIKISVLVYCDHILNKSKNTKNNAKKIRHCKRLVVCMYINYGCI